MEKIIIYGGKGWIGNMFLKELEKKNIYDIHISNIRLENYEELEDEIEKTSRSFRVGSRQQEHNLIDALKIACRKFSKEKTGKKPFTNINLVRI